MLNGAVSFFADQLGCQEIKESRVKGDWGEARFLRPPTDPYVRLQLSEIVDEDVDGMLVGVHLAMSFADPEEAANLVLDWAHYAGIGRNCEIESVPGSKWFVSIPALFHTKFEFVPTN